MRKLKYHSPAQKEKIMHEYMREEEEMRKRSNSPEFRHMSNERAGADGYNKGSQ